MVKHSPNLSHRNGLILQPFNCLKWTINLKVGLIAMNLLHHKYHKMVYVIKTMNWPMKTHWHAAFLQIHISAVID